MHKQKGMSLFFAVVLLAWVGLLGVVGLGYVRAANAPATAVIPVTPISAGTFVAQEYKKCAETKGPTATIDDCRTAIQHTALLREDASFSLNVARYLAENSKLSAGASASQ